MREVYSQTTGVIEGAPVGFESGFKHCGLPCFGVVTECLIYSHPFSSELWIFQGETVIIARFYSLLHYVMTNSVY